MKQQTKIKIKELLLSAGKMLVSFYVIAPIILVGLLAIGMEDFTGALFASQLGILFFAFLLINFDFKFLLSQIKGKIKLEPFFMTIGLVILMFMSNAFFSIFLLKSGFTSDTTASAVNAGSILGSFILPVIFAPIAEELAFRVGLKHALVDRAKFKPITYIAISSIVFGLLHFQPGEFGLVIVLMTGTIGVIKSFIYLKTDNVLITIAAHMVYNGIIMTLATMIL